MLKQKTPFKKEKSDCFVLKYYGHETFHLRYIQRERFSVLKYSQLPLLKQIWFIWAKMNYSKTQSFLASLLFVKK